MISALPSLSRLANFPRRAALLLLPIALAACGEDPPPERNSPEAERDIALVRKANGAQPPRREVTPEPIQFEDIEANDMFGLACSYAPGTSLNTRVVAREEDAFMKIEGEVLRFAADPGTRELAAGTRSHYLGREYSLRLQIEGEGRPARNATEVTEYDGTVSLYDRWGREIYSGSGSVQCGA